MNLIDSTKNALLRKIMERLKSSKEKIDAAKDAWRTANWADGPFALPPGDDQEFTPLP